MKRLFILLTIVFAFAVASAVAQKPYLDSTFSGDGLLYSLSPKSSSYISDIAIQADGKTVSSIWRDDMFELLRVNTDGTIDNSFGASGYADLDIATLGVEGIYSIAIQPDGKILAGGYMFTSGTGNDFAVARFNTDGTPDNSFGTNGVATLNTGGNANEYGRKLLLRPNGKIVLVGVYTSNSSVGKQVIAQFNADGTLDNSFGTNGYTIANHTTFQTDALGAALQADGRIVTTGSIYDGLKVDVAVARYNTDGTIDNTFNSTGWVKYDLGSTSLESGMQVMVQSTGKIVIGSKSSVLNLVYAAIRFNTDGTLDNTFGTAGVAKHQLSINSNVYNTCLMLGNDDFLLAGGANTSGTDFDYGIVKFDANGKVIAGYGNGGMITTDFVGEYDMVYAMAMQADGKLVAAGSSRTSGNTISYPSMARYKPAVTNSVHDVVNKVNVSVYPNPNTGNIHIEGDSNTTLYVVSITGQVLHTLELNAANNYKTTVTNLATGIHFLKAADGSYASRIVTVSQ